MSEPWNTTTSYGRADLTRHPLIREAYKVACLIERCGASPELTAASCTAFALCESLSDYFLGLDAGRVNAPSGTTSEPVATEPQGSAGESPASIHRPSNPVDTETNRDKVLRGEVVKVTDGRLQEMQRIARANEGFGLELYHWHWLAVVNELTQMRADWKAICEAADAMPPNEIERELRRKVDRLRAALHEVRRCFPGGFTKALWKQVDQALSGELIAGQSSGFDYGVPRVSPYEGCLRGYVALSGEPKHNETEKNDG